MRKPVLILLFSIFALGHAFSQTPGTSCGQKEITERLYRENPALKNFQEEIEKNLRFFIKNKQADSSPIYQPNAVLTLPVVVHIIHNNGSENISDAQVFTAIQHLNEAFANTGYYDPSDGVNTEIQFCLAQRDPNNNPTNGINRVQSPLTVMDGWNNSSQDLAVKNLSRWDPRCYINIWIVKEIIGPVAGYAYLPSAHGMNIDGIVGEAAYFGSSYPNDILIIHEMGHYLGLYHTFQGGCKNDDCSKDGDQVCDTPPDQSTAGISCNSTVNSCSTDINSGFSADVNDLHKDYLDYGNWNCMKVFTQGQADRMNWMIQNVRKSLLNCKSCLPPCPAPVTANFSSSSNNVTAGTTVNFTNSSINASAYRWYINNVIQSSATNYSFTFNTAGTYIIQLSALTTNPLCDSAIKFDTIRVTCPVNASFSPLNSGIFTNTTINFTNLSTGATTYQWYVNNVFQTATPSFSYSFSTTGLFTIKLVADNGFCKDSISGFVNVRDSCTPQLNYQRVLKKTGDDLAFANKTTRDGGSIVAGGAYISGTQFNDALLQKFDKDGNLEWSVATGGNSNEQFFDVIELGNGDFAAIGESFTNTPAGAAFVARFSPTGSIIWSKPIYTGSATGEAGKSLFEAPDGSIVIAGVVNNLVGVSDIFLGRLSATGNVIWSRSFNNGNEETANKVVVDGLKIFVVGSVVTGGFKRGLLMQLDLNGINFSSTIYSNPNFNIEFTDVHLSGFAFAITGRANNNHFIARLSSAGFVLNSHMINAGMPDATTFNQAYMNADLSWVNVQSSFNGNEIKVQKIDSSGSVLWARKFQRSSPTHIRSISRISDNGFHATGSTIGSSMDNEIFIARLDSIGCNGVPDQVQYRPLPLTESNLSWAGSSTPTSIFSPNSITTNPAYTIETICSSTPCTTDPPTDTCGQQYFQKKIGSDGSDYAFDVKVLAGNEYLLAGSTIVSQGSNNDEEALLIKLNNRGSLIWQKKWGQAGRDRFTKIVTSTNGEYYVFGDTRSQSNRNGSMLLGKFDATGNILWMREYNFTHNSLTGFDNVASAIELPNGDLAFCANAPGINTDVGQPLPATYNIIGVLSNTGTIKWVKRFREYYIESGGPVVGISAVNNALFVAASYGVIKLSIADGTLMGLQKKYLNLGGLISIEATGSGLIVYSNSHQLLIDENLNLIAAYRMVTPFISYSWNNAGFSSETGSTIQGSNNSTNNDNAVQLTRFMEAGKLNWSYRYPYPVNEERQLWGSRNTLDGGTVAIGSLSKKINGNNNEPADIFVLRTDSQGRIPDCRRASTNITLESEQGQFVELVARNYPLITQTITPTLSLQDANLGVQSLCNTDKCNLLDIHSKDTVCSFTDTVSIFATRDSACDGFTEWITDSSEVRILSSTDSLLKIQVKRLGTIRIYARINAGCRLLSDSLNITVLKSPDSVNLGPDIQLCKISTYTFNAGSGFKTYVWQDGSTDSTLTIFNPGTYHVTVTDYCGNSYRDTVIVSQAPDIPFDLGADRELCSNDTLTITAPPGFVKYYWSPNYRINNLYTQSIRVSPQKDTTYIVIAEKAPGCLVTDSIRIKVNKADSLFIGNDTSFCQNDTITLTANPGFVSYQWNTGNTNPSIGVFNKGRYWVKATNSKGCVSYDTLEIVNLYNLPVINLGNDFSLCRDKIHVFDAGNHLAYQWQDGSSSRTFSTSSPGTYWATVTNSNGCIASDTVKIISLLENPKGFLDSTADICTGQRLELQAAPGYREYLWYNNSRSSVITITSPGSYWLQVTNGDGCISRDTILVKAKDCIKGVFFPNAFTPANGGGNNYFRPIVYGQLESFHLIVFNRWGQKVFESRDPFKGWDGRINGQLQDTQSFTWTATYQFSGTNEKKEIDKGTVVLIR